MTDTICPDVLLVGDDIATTRVFLEVLASKGIRGTLVRTAPAAAERIEQRPWDLLVMDLDGADNESIALVRLVKCHYPELPIVMLSGRPSVAAAVRAVREGCHDYLAKPVERAEIEALMDALLPSHAVPVAAADCADSRCLFQIAGQSPRLFEIIALAKRVAPTSLPVLITGESGTGKELVSYLVHRSSSRAQGPYVRVNFAALSESLLESELFGHERGAFTGACAQHKGRFERAHGGTLLLDEVSETGPRLQSELLRVLEQQDFERVGGSAPISVNVRIISTTNRDLYAEVQRGAFRADLYYRLVGIRIAVPPLRHRKEDIPVLVWHFVNQYAREVRRAIRQLDPEMMELLRHHHWPGNVRQLRNVVRTALVMGEGPVLSLAGVPWMQAELRAAAEVPAPVSVSLREVERRAILEAMRLTGSHQAKAARLLGITDRTLREKLRRYRQESPVEAEAWMASSDGGGKPMRAARRPPEELEPLMAGEVSCLKEPA
ncbi:MAG: sigma-54 dependent transcriptional regulator [Planctomycetota bacterium]|nr:sigma-54 dependent transcriptional regulator [Planctomycetota bacterium]